MPIKATVWSILVFLPLMPLAAELTEFRNGERADAEAINGNFRALNQALESMQQTTAACEIFSRQGNTTVACPEGSSLSNGGFALTDAEGSMLASHPTSNGWRCEASTATDPENLTCYARCCGIINGAMLARNLYCNSNYCWDSTSNFPNYNIHTHYLMTLTKGEFRAFPMEIDESFVFPPESIGAASLLVRYQGEAYHVTNLDADCLAEDPDRPWSECFTAWQNSDVLEAAMRSGTLLAAPGPLNVLDEFRIGSRNGVALRINLKESNGYTVEDARLESTGYTAYRVSEGTGSRNGGNCQEHSFWGAVSVGGIIDNERGNVRFYGAHDENTPAEFQYPFRALFCSDSPVGVFTYKMLAIDGVGGKRYLGDYTVRILEAKKPGGQIIPD